MNSKIFELSSPLSILFFKFEIIQPNSQIFISSFTLFFRTFSISGSCLLNCFCIAINVLYFLVLYYNLFCSIYYYIIFYVFYFLFIFYFYYKLSKLSAQLQVQKADRVTSYRIILSGLFLTYPFFVRTQDLQLLLTSTNTGQPGAALWTFFDSQFFEMKYENLYPFTFIAIFNNYILVYLQPRIQVYCTYILIFHVNRHF